MLRKLLAEEEAKLAA
jgi:hypothetical protein